LSDVNKKQNIILHIFQLFSGDGPCLVHNAAAVFLTAGQLENLRRWSRIDRYLRKIRTLAEWF